MPRRKKNMLSALLLAPFLLTAGVMGVGETQARYAQTVICNTVLHGAPGAVGSNCLLPDTKQVILLGEHISDTALSVNFTLESSRDFAERLQWHCSGMASVDVRMELWMEQGVGSLSEDQVLQLAAGSRAEICMTVTPAEPVTDPTEVSVRVLCGELEGTFRVNLLPVPQLPEEPEPAEPTEPVEPTEPSEPTEPTEPSEPTEPTESGETTEPAEPSEPAEELLPLEAEQPAEEDIPEELPSQDLQIRTFRQMERQDLLPVKVELIEKPADRMVLGMDGGSFPEFTRYSLDAGETWYLLYYGGTIEASAPEAAPEENLSWTMMLDLSAASLEGQDQWLLEAKTYDGETETGSASFPVELLESVGRAQSSWVLTKPRWDSQSVEQSEDQPTEPSEGQDSTEPTDDTQAAQISEGDEPEQPPGEELIRVPLDPNASFVLPLPVGWEECDVEFGITGMTADDTGVRYTPVILDPMSLCVQRGEDPGTLIVWVGPNLPPAGKYRLTVEASFEGICFDRMEETFFINYYPQSDTQSSEVTDHD